MSQLPTEVLNRLDQTTRKLKAVFEITKADDATFVNANKEFVDFHEKLGIDISLNDILETDLEEYFRYHL